jgi:hypothetical protein
VGSYGCFGLRGVNELNDGLIIALGKRVDGHGAMDDSTGLFDL